VASIAAKQACRLRCAPRTCELSTPRGPHYVVLPGEFYFLPGAARNRGKPATTLREGRAESAARRVGRPNRLDLDADIEDWVEHWNENPNPYAWTKTAEESLTTSPVLRNEKTVSTGPFRHAGRGTRTPDTRIMIPTRRVGEVPANAYFQGFAAGRCRQMCKQSRNFCHGEGAVRGRLWLSVAVGCGFAVGLVSSPRRGAR
jgi:hypothetical protein